MSKDELTALIISGQKDLKDEVRGLTEDVRELTAQISSLAGQVQMQTCQTERILNKLDHHSTLLAKQAVKVSSLETTRENYYRFGGKGYSEEKKPSTKFLSMPPRNWLDIVKFIGIGILGLGAIFGTVLGIF